MAYIKLKHTSITHDLDDDDFVTVLGGSVTYSGKKNNSAEPTANGNDIVEVQTQSYDNPLINISNIKLHDTTYLNINDIHTLYKARYDGTDPITLKIAYDTTDKIVPGMLTDTSILVILETFSIVLDARNSDKAYMPVASLSFIETK
jgi:hypothetical protein